MNANHLNGVEILLIEDNSNDQELTMRALKKRNIANKVQIVNDGEEALEYLFGEGKYAGRDVSAIPKVVLLDLKLPKVSGLDVLKRIKSDPHTKTIPVVVLTSSMEERDRLQSYELGVNSYIVKPVDFDKFVEAVSELGFYWLLLNEPPVLAQTP